MKEIERKWLVAGPVPPHFEEHTIEQGYIVFDGTTSVRIRCEVSDAGMRRFELTVKRGKGLTRTEVTSQISEDYFDDLWDLIPEGQEISKYRRFVRLDGDCAGYVAETDFFMDHLEGLVLIEVEFDSEWEAMNFQAPEWFGEEVTDDSRYSNLSLSQNGKP